MNKFDKWLKTHRDSIQFCIIFIIGTIELLITAAQIHIIAAIIALFMILFVWVPLAKKINKLLLSSNG